MQPGFIAKGACALLHPTIIIPKLSSMLPEPWLHTWIMNAKYYALFY
jgi:hypothetical protein